MATDPSARIIPIGLETLDPAFPQDWRLRPVGLLTGGIAAAALASGRALPLAGGSVAFTQIELLASTPDGVKSAWGAVPVVRHWASQQGIELRERLETQLCRLSEKRERWADLALDRPLVMGIVNATPDSFYFGNPDAASAIALGRAMRTAGADILDIGGESTRPGATPIGPEEEWQRIEPVIRALVSDGAVVSVDTRHATVMEAAHAHGVRIVNDVSALTGEASLGVAARTGLPVVLMHMQGDPGTMQQEPHYQLPSLDILNYLRARIAACIEAGVPRHRIVIDPGIGFGKTVAHNLEIQSRLTLFHGLGCGVLVGLSRKSTIGRVSGGAPLDARLPGSLAGALAALAQGVQILRVHDVAETRQAIAVWQAIANGS